LTARRPLGSAVVVHRFDDEGEYDVELGPGGVRCPTVWCCRFSPQATDGRGWRGPSSVTIDAAGRRARVENRPCGGAGCRAGGFASFTSGAREERRLGYRRARRRGPPRESRVRQPSPRRARHLRRDARCAPASTPCATRWPRPRDGIVVTYPVVGETPVPAPPTRWTWCAPKKGFDPKRLENRAGPGDRLPVRGLHRTSWSSCSSQTTAPRRGPGGRWSGGAPAG